MTKSTMRKEPNAHKLPCTTCILLLTQEKIIKLDTESQKLRLNDIVEKQSKEQHLCIIKKVAKQSMPTNLHGF